MIQKTLTLLAMTALSALHAAEVDEPQVRFVDQRRRLETMVGALLRHAPPRDLVQFAVHERHELLEGGLVTAAPRQQQARNLSRWCRHDMHRTPVRSRELSLQDRACPVLLFS